QSQKHLELQPGQTLSDFALVDFPMVRAVTRFLIIWAQATNHVLGIVPIDVYPPDLLKELRPLAAGQPIAVYDPQNELKPLLENLSLDFEDVELIGWERCQATLAFVFSNAVSNGNDESVARGIDILTRNEAAVVCIRSDLDPGQDVWSSPVSSEQRK